MPPLRVAGLSALLLAAAALLLPTGDRGADRAGSPPVAVLGRPTPGWRVLGGRQWPITETTLWDGRTVFSRGRVGRLAVFAWRGRPGGVPDGLATRRQLRSAGWRPNGQDPYALLMFGHRKPYRRIEFADLFRIDLAAPKRVATRAQLAAISKALMARRTCPECRQVKDYYLPTSEDKCWECLFPGQ